LKILGISAFYHDSAAAMVCDDQILAAAQEERFTRIKHDESFPTNAIKYCLKELLLMLKQNKNCGSRQSSSFSYCLVP
jgi:predicted NodU family carbamoyl transferase